ncbi:hypothetical protein DFH09DRAFT_1427242 [Mycena vulgaris]|nr:hypothetical protein DFH09DRAFT_1427242 [Mycena vulgaris]
MAARPNVLFVTLFRYTAGAAIQINIPAITESPVSVSTAGAGVGWKDICRGVAERAGGARGCMQLHVLQVTQGTEKRWWVVPLRTSSARIHDRLRESAACLTKSEGPDLTEEIDAVLRDSGDAVEIH